VHNIHVIVFVKVTNDYPVCFAFVLIIALFSSIVTFQPLTFVFQYKMSHLTTLLYRWSRHWVQSPTRGSPWLFRRIKSRASLCQWCIVSLMSLVQRSEITTCCAV